MKKVVAITLVGLTVFLTTVLGVEYFWKDRNDGSVASPGSDKKDVASPGDNAKPTDSGAEPGQKSLTDQVQEGSDGEPVGTDVAAEKGNKSVIPSPGRTVSQEETNIFQERLKKLKESQDKRLNLKQVEKNTKLLEQIKEEKALIEDLKELIVQQKNSAEPSSDNVADDSTRDARDKSGTDAQGASGAPTPVGPKTAKIWAERWGKLELKQRTLFVRKLDEIDGVADVVVILQQMKPEQIAETLAQLAKEDKESAADADKDSEGEKQDLAARLVMAMMKAEKDAEKKATE